MASPAPEPVPHEGPDRSTSRVSGRRPALLAALLLLAVLAAYYAAMLPRGAISHFDEYFALDRSHSFVIHDDYWTVHSENRPTFKKPPLQYWMSAALMARGVAIEPALRLPSYVFALITLATVGWLAFQLSPSIPWVAPASMLILAGSTRFWEAAISGLLDSGALLFSTFAVAATFAALRDPRWWYAVAIACILGALQKAPLPPLFVAAILAGLAATMRHHGFDLRRALANRHFAIALFLAAAGTAFWPALQWLRHGAASFEEAYVSQMVERFSPFGEATGNARSFFTRIFNGEAPLRILGMLALGWLVFARRRMEFAALAVPLLCYAVIVAFAKGLVSPRYSLHFLPFLAVAAATAAFGLFSGRRARIAAVAVLALLAFGPIKTTGQLDLDGGDQVRFIPIASEIGAQLKPEETLVFCWWHLERPRPNPGMLSYYASNGRPFHRIESPEVFRALLDEGSIRFPLRGLCSAGALGEIAPFLGGLARLSEQEGLVHFTAGGRADTP